MHLGNDSRFKLYMLRITEIDVSEIIEDVLNSNLLLETY